VDDPITTVGLTIIAMGLVLYLRAEDRRLSAQSPSQRASSPSKPQRGAQGGGTPTPILSPTLSSSETDVSLATSLPVQDVVNPPPMDKLPSVHHQDLAVDLPPGAEASAIPEDGHGDRPTILEEIASLGQAGQEDAIAQLSHHIEDPDHTVRAAVASALGNLATDLQGPRLDEALIHLNHLSHDGSSEVRMEAATALAKIPAANPSVPNTNSSF